MMSPICTNVWLSARRSSCGISVPIPKFFAGLADGSVSSFNAGLWAAILLAPAGVMGRSRRCAKAKRLRAVRTRSNERTVRTLRFAHPTPDSLTARAPLHTDYALNLMPRWYNK